MAKTKISEFNANPALNTDIDSINIAEGCSPSGINDAIRELMAQLKDFQTGAVGDSFNGPVGTTTAAAGAFTTLTTTGTINNLTVGRGAGAVATNTAVGASALAANTSGGGMTAVGSGAFASNTTGAVGAAFGTNAGTANTTGNYNVVFGPYALDANTTGSSNTAVGSEALGSNTTASNNTAVGYQAGYATTTGAYNTLVGNASGSGLTTGGYNTFLGSRIVPNSFTGSYNTLIGDAAGNALTGSVGSNTFIGQAAGAAITTGAKNTIVGSYSGNQGGLDIRTSSNYIVLSDGDGNPVFKAQNNASWALQGASVVGGAGISFPATQSASSDANTLDDYEEGTWTPVIGSEGGGTSATYNYQSGVYRKIGSMVYVQFGVNLATLTAGSGTVTISGLPFASIQRGGYQEASNPIQSGQLTNSAYAGNTYFFVGNSQATMFGRYINNADSIIPASVLQGGASNVGSYLNGIMVYCSA